MRQFQNQRELFKYNDRIRRVYLKKLLRLYSAFNREMGALSLDELNALSGSLSYANKLNEAIKALIYEYLLALVVYYYGYITEKEQKEPVFYGVIDDYNGDEKTIDFDGQKFLNEYLESYNPVTQYLFFPELERKKSRLVESVIAVQAAQKTKGLKVAAIAAAIATAQRLMARQLIQYGDCITLIIVQKAYEDCGVQKVMWHTQEDFKVCADCDKLDGELFDIDQVPPPQHYNCRCWVSPV